MRFESLHKMLGEAAADTLGLRAQSLDQLEAAHALLWDARARIERRLRDSEATAS